MEMDANTFASWGVDYVKLDGCYSNVDQYADGKERNVFSTKLLVCKRYLSSNITCSNCTWDFILQCRNAYRYVLGDSVNQS